MNRAGRRVRRGGERKGWKNGGGVGRRRVKKEEAGRGRKKAGKILKWLRGSKE